MNEVRCPGREVCPDKGCIHAEPHTIGKGCTEPCEGYRGQAQGSTCQPYSDLTYPLPPPRGPKSYVCNEAGECGIEDCTAAEAHTHNEPPLHGPRECGFTHQVVRCREVGVERYCDTRWDCGNKGICAHSLPHVCEHGDERWDCHSIEGLVRCNPVPSAKTPLNLSGTWQPRRGPRRGVWVSGKALEVLSQYQDWSNDKWDAFWAIVTGKATRSTDAKRVMREANGPEVPDMTAALWYSTIKTIIHVAIIRVDEHGQQRGTSAAQAATQIVELPRPETP